jgi:hypothetical protein
MDEQAVKNQNIPFVQNDRNFLRQIDPFRFMRPGFVLLGIFHFAMGKKTEFRFF